MNCKHCQGVMREEQFFDCEGIPGLMWMRGWKCVNCGHAVKPLKEATRLLKEVTMHALP